MSNREDVLLAGLAGIIIFTVGICIESCQQKSTNKTLSIAGIQQKDIKDGWKPRVTIRPSSTSIETQARLLRFGEGILQSNIRTEFSIQGSTSSSGSKYSGHSNDVNHPKSDEISIRYNIPTRTNNLEWSPSDGVLEYDWYGICFAPGAEVIKRYGDNGLGVDIRGLYISDVGFQLGADFFKHSKVALDISIGYNLRRISMLSNIDIIAGVDWNKTIFGGLRVEIGRK